MNVLVVDDEIYFRKALIATTDWEAVGIEQCFEAENGKEALEKVREGQIDIVLADINMPQMDGLEFARKVGECNLGTKIIFISGYDDFRYAKEAISLGADAYLLKPVNEEELAEALTSAVLSCRKERQFSKKMEHLQMENIRNVTIKKQYYLQQGLLSESETEMKKWSNKILNLDPSVMKGKKNYFFVVGECGTRTDSHEEDYNLWNFTGANYMEELLEKWNGSITLPDFEKRIVFWIPIEDENEKKAMEKELEAGQRILNDFFGFVLYLGTSRMYSTSDKLGICYEEAVNALESRKNDEQTLVRYGEQERETDNYEISDKVKMQLRLCLKEQKAEETEKTLQEIFRGIEKQCVPLGRLRILCIEILILCVDLLSDADIIYGKSVSQWKIDMFEEIRRKKSFRELENYIYVFCGEMCSKKERKREVLPENVKKVLTIIEEKYADPELNVDNIAKEIYVNYNYLCVIFKKALHTTINEYLLKYRMQKALECFNSGCLQVQEAAEQTGYSNVGYFTKCFRKEFGMTPSQYMKSIR